MSVKGSQFGNCFLVSTFGESHGKALGAVIDGCPSGVELCEEDIQVFLDRRKPGQSKYATRRSESDKCHILSGVFNGKTTGTPIAVVVYNEDQHSSDYDNLAECFRPGHADYTFAAKFGPDNRDYRGGGRSSGRETIARVIAGAIAAKVLKSLGITAFAYTKSIGPVTIQNFNKPERDQNALLMPDTEASKKAEEYLNELMANQDSSGGVIECVIDGVKCGLGNPVFDKLDARLAAAVMSIGAVKGFEVGDGFEAAALKGSENNDEFFSDETGIKTRTNHCGGILGGISVGTQIVFRAAVKPTPSISREQKTVDKQGNETMISIKGRHDPVIVPRAVVVVEAMALITILDMLMSASNDRIENLQRIWGEQR